MSQITHFCCVKLLAWKSGCVKFWTNIMSAGNLLALKVLLEDHWPMIWDLGQNYDEKSNWQKYDNAVVRCRIFLLCGELEMRILWDSRCHAHVCKMPREIINCPLYPIGWGTRLNLCISFCYSVLQFVMELVFSQAKTSRWNENGWIKLCFGTINLF